MAKGKKLKFGSGYKHDFKKPPLEDWKEAKEYYLKNEGLDIGDYPVLTNEEEKELTEKLEFLTK
jgi:hypothetical protein